MLCIGIIICLQLSQSIILFSYYYVWSYSHARLDACSNVCHNDVTLYTLIPEKYLMLGRLGAAGIVIGASYCPRNQKGV